MGSELGERRILLDERDGLLEELVHSIDVASVVGFEVDCVVVDALVQDFFDFVHQVDDFLEE